MNELIEMLRTGENILIKKVLAYAKQHEYTRYTSTLEEAWRLSISGLTRSIADAAATLAGPPELGPDAPAATDPLTRFGVLEARLHRRRGVTLAMFLGLLKYYRQGYIDLIAEQCPEARTRERYRYFIDRCFDTIEVAFSAEWSEVPDRELLEELQTNARYMTNEKNAYLTVFESLADPVIMLDSDGLIITYNHAAARLIDARHVPGGLQYHHLDRAGDAASLGKSTGDATNRGRPLQEVFPWLVQVLADIKEAPGCEDIHECVVPAGAEERAFAVSLSDMLDVSEKFTSSIIILRDITALKKNREALTKTVEELRKALAQVNQLSGLLPMCANCRKIRDDQGYWNRLDVYLKEHAPVNFSHGICPECARTLYPEFYNKRNTPPKNKQEKNGHP